MRPWRVFFILILLRLALAFRLEGGTGPQTEVTKNYDNQLS